jgi:hypothetical protein
MKKPSKTVSVQLPTEDIEALESIIGKSIPAVGGPLTIKRLSDSIRYAMADTLADLKFDIEQARLKEAKAAAAKAKREAKKAAASGI